ncbi:MAG: energy-coupling factor ABC transporter ATP-binding protein [Candidatus Desulfofervidus auxilii]|nr:energy-coupling factor ABC transporter ATP-binding protein [Candidatus Desulfofervidus auxilii]
MEIIKLENITFAYPGQKPLFKSLTFSFRAKERIGITGPNGVGKTTLLQIIMGLLKPQQGQVIIFGKERKNEVDFYPVYQKIGFMFQDPEDQLFCPTVAEDIAFGPLNLGLERKQIKQTVEQTLSIVGLNGFEDRVTYKLSGGEKRLVALATLLAMKPEVLILDEPIGDLDPSNIQRLILILNQFPGSLIVVSHEQEFLPKVTQKSFWFEDSKFLPLNHSRL